MRPPKWQRRIWEGERARKRAKAFRVLGHQTPIHCSLDVDTPLACNPASRILPRLDWSWRAKGRKPGKVALILV